MNTIARALIVAGMIATAPAIAGHEGHEADAKAAAGDPRASDCQPDRKALFDITIANMEVQMEAIRQTDDPDERRRLLRNHMQTIAEALDLLDDRKVAAPADREKQGKDKAKGMGKGMGMMRGTSMHRDLEQRVDRLQKLLEQMIEHEQAESDRDQG